MGFFRRLFGAKKSTSSTSSAVKEKRRWSFTRFSDNTTKTKRPSRHATFDGSLDPNKHAIAVAAATAAVAEAALAAAHAAEVVVRLTSAGGRAGRVSQQRRAEGLVVAAVVKIQSAFRGYLARRALKALKALVKLQALVRGHIVRKQTADMLKRMQTLVKLQAQACASRAHTTIFDEPSILKRCGSNTNFRDVVGVVDKARLGSNWLDGWMEESIWNNQGVNPRKTKLANDEKSDKILEVDTWKPHLNSQQHSRTYYNSFMTIKSPSKLSEKSLDPSPSKSSGEVVSISSLKHAVGKGEAAALRSVRRGSFTPTKSECSWGFFGSYSGHPNYMANTESSRAKVRSQSAPRQRLELGQYSSTNRSSTRGFWDGESNSEGNFPLHSDFRTKAFPATDSPTSAFLR